MSVPSSSYMQNDAYAAQQNLNQQPQYGIASEIPPPPIPGQQQPPQPYPEQPPTPMTEPIANPLIMPFAGGAGKSRRRYAAEQYDLTAAPVVPVADPVPAAAAAAQYGQPVNTMYTPAGVPEGALDASAVAPGVGQPLAQQTYGGYQPISAQPAVAMQQRFAQMNLGSQPPAQPAKVPSQTSGPLNQLYNIDLLQQLPVQISDLALPPPPIILPANSAVTNSPTSNAAPPYMRSTLNAVPTTSALLKKSKLPFSVVIQPYTSLRESEAPIPVVADSIISRCRRCRTYINPYISFIDQGHKWRCNMCNLTNDVPTAFDWDARNQKQVDRWSRPELNNGVVEFVAPSEYMARPPQPLIITFLIDVSAIAVTTGLVATAARTIVESLDRIPNKDKRTRLAFICVDSSLHYFTVAPPPQSQDPSMIVVSDLDEPFLPVPHNLLIPLAECREGIETLLNRMGDMFANSASTTNAMGPALKAAHKLVGNVGGKVICLMASMPNVGIGKLEPRDDKKATGTASEKSLLQTQSSFYKSFAVECSKSQVSVDMFLFSSQYQDVASLSNLPRYTSGQTYFYPGWNAGRSEDAIKFAHEFGEHLSMESSLEAVLRVRSSNGVRVNTFYGNFFTRSSDLCAFPSFPRDQTYSVEVTIDETITKPFVCMQAAVLLTTCNGERRIRVITLCLPTTTSLTDVYASADQIAITAFFAQRAAEKALSSGLNDARELIVNKLGDMLQTYKKELMTSNVGASAPLQFCANLRMLPLLVLALIKHVSLRKSVQIPSDLRSAALDLLGTLPVKFLLQYIHPDFYSLHDMPQTAGEVDPETGVLALPPKINLSAERMERHGLYLIYDGQTLFLWIGRDAVPQLIMDVFGVPSLEHVKTGKTTMPLLESEFSKRINAIISKLREKMGSITWPHLYVVREDGDPSLKLWATTFLIEDRVDQGQSYMQFLTSMRDRVN
ncbi:hypothetical protein V1512DRAFT_287066 [Lipomyces arxii]|uniref:uncharacterized protein n=1 Tax=Lipomyces arxii TaxID=56418 RepID=UPI0034CDB621